MEGGVLWTFAVRDSTKLNASVSQALGETSKLLPIYQAQNLNRDIIIGL